MVTKDGSVGNITYRFLSSDTKPTKDVPINAMGLELDTGDLWYFDTDGSWKKVGGN